MSPGPCQYKSKAPNGRQQTRPAFIFLVCSNSLSTLIIGRVIVKKNLEPWVQRCKGSVVEATKGYKGIIMLTVEQICNAGLVRGKKCTMTDFCLPKMSGVKCNSVAEGRRGWGVLYVCIQNSFLYRHFPYLCFLLTSIFFLCAVSHFSSKNLSIF
jgi:hypothetical protein